MSSPIHKSGKLYKITFESMLNTFFVSSVSDEEAATLTFYVSAFTTTSSFFACIFGTPAFIKASNIGVQLLKISAETKGNLESFV